MGEQAKAHLIQSLYQVGAIKFGEFQLKAGGISPIYVDLREIISHPALLKEIAEIVTGMLKDRQFNSICGVPYGALALASVVSIFSNTPMVMLRKEAKEHGTKKRVEGKFTEGETCLVIEDVVTTGSSVAESAQILRAHGLIVHDAIVVLDREAGAAEKLSKEGIHSFSILKLSELVAHLPSDLDPELRMKVEGYLSNNISVIQAPAATPNDMWSLDQRRAAIKHPMARRLFDIMINKKSNLCVAADLTSASSILQLARDIGSHLCAFKLHADIIQDFSMEFAKELQNLASQLDFLILEDRKFADTGNIVALQTSGVHHLKSWADIFTVHGVSGPGVLQGLQTVCNERPIGCLLIAQMSSENNLLDQNYQNEICKMASLFPDLVAGFICQKRVTDNPGFLYLSPGVHLEKTGDNLGQQWRSPEEAIGRDKVDIVIVGRGVINDPDRKAAAERYREESWCVFSNRK